MVSFPLEMRELLYRIKVLEIRNAFGLVRVFQNGDKSNINHQSSSGAKLKSLTLENLPNLTHVWDEMTITSCFDILDYIIVARCEKLKYLLPSSITFFNLVENSHS
ncbi:unnamed protein product [Citrullus colocynthis]|uniref:Disease resistance protein At4g27190-like leucine-rich repeats domain-containing protein n=1 Tax=Citrullus colocynthis TaxID=252529 RepID=A0ABP0YYD7_9ROSI